MSTKHTPGPWKVCETDTNDICIRPEIPEFVGEDAPQGWGICGFSGPAKVHKEFTDLSSLFTRRSHWEFDARGLAVYERNKANAALIAAAPEMLAQLERCLENIRTLNAIIHDRCPDLRSGGSDTEFMIEKAIAKARGGTVSETKTYLGDGAYVEDHGFQVRLYCEREHGEHEVYLDHEAIAALIRFLQQQGYIK